MFGPQSHTREREIRQERNNSICVLFLFYDLAADVRALIIGVCRRDVSFLALLSAQPLTALTYSSFIRQSAYNPPT